MVVSCAQLFSILLKKRSILPMLLALFFVCQLLMSRPTVITPQDSWVFASDWPRILLLVLGTLLITLVVWVLREELRSELREKFDLIVLALKR
jgi:protein-S-isoprenylcysteine O-methyltransferase Ste14